VSPRDVIKLLLIVGMLLVFFITAGHVVSALMVYGTAPACCFGVLVFYTLLVVSAPLWAKEGSVTTKEDAVAEEKIVDDKMQRWLAGASGGARGEAFPPTPNVSSEFSAGWIAGRQAFLTVRMDTGLACKDLLPATADAVLPSNPAQGPSKSDDRPADAPSQQDANAVLTWRAVPAHYGWYYMIDSWEKWQSGSMVRVLQYFDVNGVCSYRRQDGEAIRPGACRWYGPFLMCAPTDADKARIPKPPAAE
jgi:hypothetical protein